MKNRRTGQRFTLTASLLLLGSGLPPASAQLLGPEFLVNSYTTNSQRSPAVAADASGSFVVVWASTLQDGSSVGVFGQRYDSAGSAVGSEFQVDSYTTSTQTGPGVAALGSGGFVVVWGSNGSDLASYGVSGQLFDAAGDPQGNEFQINSFTAGVQRIPAVAADGAGDFVAVWLDEEQYNPDKGVFGQRFDSAGGRLGSEFQVSTSALDTTLGPAMATEPSGSFVVAWTDFGPDGSNYGAFAQRFDSAGDKAGSEFRINDYTTGAQRRPAVAMHSSGSFVVAWDSDQQDGDSLGVLAQRFDAAGARVGSEFLVNSYTTSAQLAPEVAMDGDGKFVVVWVSNPQDGSYEGLFGQRFDAAGGRVGSEFQVNSSTTGRQEQTAVAADGAGNFVVAWRSSVGDGSSYGVFGQRLINWIFFDGFEAENVCAWSDDVGSGDSCPFE